MLCVDLLTWYCLQKESVPNFINPVQSAFLSHISLKKETSIHEDSIYFLWKL